MSAQNNIGHPYRMIVWDDSPGVFFALKTVSQKVRDKDMDFARLVGSDLLAILQANTGRMGGLAANQVGIHKQVMVLPNIGILFNPTFTYDPDVRSEVEPEGCYSLPGAWYLVRRPHAIWAKWMAPDGVRQVRYLLGWPARIFMHEYDHLRGRLISDKPVSTMPYSSAVAPQMKLPEGWE